MSPVRLTRADHKRMRQDEMRSLRRRVAILERENAELREQLAGAMASLEGEFGPGGVEPQGKSAERLALEAETLRTIQRHGHPPDPAPLPRLRAITLPLAFQPGDIVTFDGMDRHRVVRRLVGVVHIADSITGEVRRLPPSCLTLVPQTEPEGLALAPGMPYAPGDIVTTGGKDRHRVQTFDAVTRIARAVCIDSGGGFIPEGYAGRYAAINLRLISTPEDPES